MRRGRESGGRSRSYGSERSSHRLLGEVTGGELTGGDATQRRDLGAAAFVLLGVRAARVEPTAAWRTGGGRGVGSSYHPPLCRAGVVRPPAPPERQRARGAARAGKNSTQRE